MKQKIAIIFPDEHLAYSPTTLNLKEALSRYFDVKVITFRPTYFKPLESNDVLYLKQDGTLFRIFNFLARYLFGIKIFFLRAATWKKIAIRWHLLFHRYNHLVITDLQSLWMTGRVKNTALHLLSLELGAQTVMFKDRIDINACTSIIVQSEKRLSFISDDRFTGKVFFIQNSPAFTGNKQKENAPCNKLIYTGTATKEYGILRYLDFLEAYPAYTLTVHGSVPVAEATIIQQKYQGLIESKRLVISTEYLSSADLIDMLRSFRIGFCFYDLLYEGIDNINFWTAPSGKMFAYFAAGLPVIGNNIQGLDPISQHHAGIQVKEMTPEAIKQAIDTIEYDYNAYSARCFAAAEFFDSSASIGKFVDFVAASAGS